MKIKDNKAIVFLTILLNLILVISLNYVVSRNLKENKYAMDDFSSCFEKSSSTRDINLDFLCDFDDVSVIGKTKDKNIVALFDSSNDYYLKANKRINLSKLRYFSKDDYKNKSKVKIKLSSLKNNDISARKENEFEVINYFFEGSAIFKEGENEVLNFFALPLENYKTIYINAKSKESLNILEEKFKSLEFKKIYINRRNSILDSIKIAFNDKYAKFMLISSIFTYFIFCYTFIVNISKYNKYFKISFESGANFFSIFKNFSKKIILFNIITIVLSFLFLDVFFRFNLKKFLYFKEIFLIFLFVLFTEILLTYIKLYFYKRLQKG